MRLNSFGFFLGFFKSNYLAASASLSFEWGLLCLVSRQVSTPRLGKAAEHCAFLLELCNERTGAARAGRGRAENAHPPIENAHPHRNTDFRHWYHALVGYQ